ncbi:hypothetical protein GCM10023115_49750 [Pontixanthobacter gangjinensis]|uniref:GyrI-like domain-containing protein n=1 Tax=Christiangramia aestuarii TaxID=1028746 RepID=A0A7K1LP40_9FLAO|nr:GyrI-like domain-containing protein [Christiangramia aestuarii]MUP42556.1 GyrI-like domain-containing protein [Christiangramia aestuarii]
MKKVFLLLLLIAVGALVWYLFIKKYDYQFETTAKYGPGAVFYELTEWRKFGLSESAENINTVSKNPFSSLRQQVKVDSSLVLEMEWEIEKINDSTTSLNLNVLSEKNQLANRWDIVNPFRKSLYIDTLKQKVLAFKKDLKEHQQTYRISDTAGLANTPGMKCICSTSRNIPVNSKANEMMQTISLLENYIIKNSLELKGYPILKVTKWDREKDIIDFDFCFPFEEQTGLSTPDNLSLKKYPAQEALKLIFNGNYRISHIAWYDILYKAQEKNLQTTGLPMEMYYNNPKINTDELNWKAEIFLPVAK